MYLKTFIINKYFALFYCLNQSWNNLEQNKNALLALYSYTPVPDSTSETPDPRGRKKIPQHF